MTVYILNEERLIDLPEQTFFNLPEAKRQRIIDAAIEEFAAYPIRDASIARIITGAGIPRGSFYQYFTDITDLYKYIILIAGNMKMEYLSKLMASMDEKPVFATIRRFYETGIRFAREHPQLAAIGNNIMKEDAARLREVFGEMGERPQQIFENILLKGKEKGEIDPKVDIEIAANMMCAINIALMDYYLDKNGFGELLEDIDSFMNRIDQMFYILENGIKAAR